jgi:hypothetical protein
MAFKKPFSRRNRYSGPPKGITVREDAPETLRFMVLDTARKLGWGPSLLRPIVCSAVRVRPDRQNWTEFPNIWEEVQALVYECQWYQVYDIIEALYAAFEKNDADRDEHDAEQFADEVNAFFVDEGIGWQCVDGEILTRGAEVFESVVKGTSSALEHAKRPTAATHIHEALQDLSRRPTPDLPGAIYHAIGSLECVARDVSGDHKATLGEILKRHPDLLPKPLDTALSQVWGFASNEARHVQEGRAPSREEAELVVGLAGVIATYLTQKSSD